MTTEISDEARELAFYAMNVTGVTTVKLERRIQSALTAARNKALEDAAKHFADAIRAMKVKP